MEIGHLYFEVLASGYTQTKAGGFCNQSFLALDLEDALRRVRCSLLPCAWVKRPKGQIQEILQYDSSIQECKIHQIKTH